MTDPTPEEEAVRRALREVADRTSAASHEPPPLVPSVRPLAPRRGVERRVLAAAAAVVVLVGGLLAFVAAGDDGDDGDELEVAGDDTTTTLEGEPTTTTSSSSTSASATSATTAATATTATTTGSTATTVEARPEVTIAEGPGWSVQRAEAAEGSCLHLTEGRDAVGQCGLDLRASEPGVVFRRSLADGRTITVVRLGPAAHPEAYGADGIWLGEREPVADPFLAGVRLYVTESSSEVVVLRNGDTIHGALHRGQLLLHDMPARYPGYRRATGSLTMGNFVEIGAYEGADGPCVLATQITPTPNVLVAACDAVPFAVLQPTIDHLLQDPFGLVPIDAGAEWTCTMPSGASCGTGQLTPVPQLGVAVLAQHGPISVDDGGARPSHVTFRVGDLVFDAGVGDG